MSEAHQRPLVVDLDGTLLPVTSRSVMLMRLARSHPSELWPYWTLNRHDRNIAKLHLWNRTGVDFDRLPLRDDLWAELRTRATTNRPLFIASGSPQELVDDLMTHLGIFRDGWGSYDDQNLVGEAKAALLVDRFGAGGFDYIGDTWDDLPVWAVTHTAVLCWPSRRLERAAQAVAARVEVLPRPVMAPVRLATLFALTAARQRRMPVPDQPRPSWPRPGAQLAPNQNQAATEQLAATKHEVGSQHHGR